MATGGGRRVEVRGVELWCVRDGAGPPCLVIHGGLGVDHSLYRATLAPLPDGHELVYYDQRGNGRSSRPPLSTLTIEQLADDAAAIVGALGLDPPIVIGHSYGGFVAQELALRHPGVARALVLLDTGPGQLGADEELAEGAGAPLPEAAAAVLASSPVFDRDAFVRGFEVLGGWSSVDRLAGIDVPALVLVGADDVFTSPPQSRRIASRLPGSELVILDDSGHFPWIDAPDAFFTAVGGWLAELEPVAPTRWLR